jgi:hypothetical protein
MGHMGICQGGVTWAKVVKIIIYKVGAYGAYLMQLNTY